MLEPVGDCPGDKLTIDSGMSGSKARHSTLKVRYVAGTIRKSCLGQLTRLGARLIAAQSATFRNRTCEMMH